jgi:hypothetical protein
VLVVPAWVTLKLVPEPKQAMLVTLADAVIGFAVTTVTVTGVRALSQPVAGLITETWNVVVLATVPV